MANLPDLQSRRGQIIGQTNRHGGALITEGYTPEHLAATIFHCLGMGTDREFHDQTGRPYRMTGETPIRGLVE